MDQPRRGGALLGWLRAHRNWCLIVLVPTLLIAAYYYLVAADQYVSEAHFVVRTSDTQPAAPSGLGQALSLVGGASSERDALLVADYLKSHDAVDALQSRIGLTERFRRPEADIVSRLWYADPTPEQLQKYFEGKAEVEVSTETGITTLKVRSFRPEDSYRIVRELIQLGEKRVNTLNRRNYANAVAMSQRQVSEAETNLAQVQGQITRFRRDERDFNPQVTGATRTSMVSELQGQLAVARAQESSMAAVLSPNSPQLVATRQRVAALSRQVGAETAKLSQGPGNVAAGMGAYENIKIRQELAGKRFELASAALQRAQDDARRQQLYVVPVVDANLPVRALYPQRTKIVLTAFLALLLIYGIGWLITAGVREHAA
ncbi:MULTISPECIES: lipopolysaccharide biosynthesis protein [unclassified Sphingomonas]|uniref:lipopolysaccharide biosynthesis protein n=1 Tax=unclassified Sphingomonas TaxID=196159 RepID=UPI0006F9937A|nr:MULTISPECIES: lipopolysaccharide biosynthesis protein [unclassified Sphingomonas]KQS46252.1 lipopolysaccharide biosynthesis protein [Sphingomonas sp. Leaf198]TCP65968.1 capsular polysaccharide transport system permease protein [Sphingomonas sp. PP-CE-1G-424]